MMRILVAFFAAVAAYAQPLPGFFPWWDSPVARDLNLSDDQQRQIRGIVSEYRSKLIDARGTTEKAEGDLQDVFNEQSVDMRRGNEAIDRLVAARGEMTKIFSQMSLRLRAVLTAQQWQELQKRRPQRPPMGEGPPGGFRRPQGQPRPPAQ